MKIHVETRSTSGNEYGDQSMASEYPPTVDIEVSDELPVSANELVAIIEGGLDLIYKHQKLRVGSWGDNGVTFKNDCVQHVENTLEIKALWTVAYGSSDSDSYMGGNSGSTIIKYNLDTQETVLDHWK